MKNVLSNITNRFDIKMLLSYQQALHHRATFLQANFEK